MENQIGRAFLILFLWFGMGAANAEVTSFTSKITAVYPLANGRVVLNFSDQPSACTGAGTPKYFYLEVGQQGVTEKAFNNIYAAALSAATTGSSVLVFFDNATSLCHINRIRVRY